MLSQTDAVAAFVSRPTEFTTDYLLIPNDTGLELGRHRGIRPFTIVGHPTVKAKKLDNTLTDVYEVRLANVEEPSFQAFWCPYAEDSIRSVMIDAAANYLLTVTMDGCSLGIGNRTPDGGHLVSHANRRNVEFDVTGLSHDQKLQTQRTFQREAQVAAITRRQQEPYAVGVQHIVQPEVYRTHPQSQEWGLLSTTFGVRDGTHNRWTFYCQRYLKTFGNPDYYKLCDLLPVHQT